MAERPRRVLIVDDEAAVSDIVRRYLTAERYEVAVAVDGGEAMTRFGSFEPDLVASGTRFVATPS